MLMIYPEKYYQDAVDFCKMFTCDAVRPRYVLGRNEYATSIARLVDVDGFIDDFSNDTEFLGKPILKMNELPIDSLVVSTVIFVGAEKFEKNECNTKNVFVQCLAIKNGKMMWT